jgi:hypothetical protein
MPIQHYSQTTLVCDLTALNAKQKERHQMVLKRLQQSVQEIREVANGYAFRYPAEISILLLLAEFISLESRCCPFLEFTLHVETEHGPAWLTLTGPEGVKEFLRAELGLEGAILEAAGQATGEEN